MPTFYDGGSEIELVEVDPRRVQEVLMKALKKSDDVVKEPQPTVRYNGTVDGFNDWGGQFSIQYWIANYAMREHVASHVWDNVWAELEEAGLCGKIDESTAKPAALAADQEPQAQPAQ
ncbi:hypothetical protein N9L49_03330 [Rhodospirillales bacterium]|nr:hypothetical protein [Rhodospirillales bacterium]